METSQLSCSADQLVGLYMGVTVSWYELKILLDRKASPVLETGFYLWLL